MVRVSNRFLVDLKRLVCVHKIDFVDNHYVGIDDRKNDNFLDGKGLGNEIDRE